MRIVLMSPLRRTVPTCIAPFVHCSLRSLLPSFFTRGLRGGLRGGSRWFGVVSLVRWWVLGLEFGLSRPSVILCQSTGSGQSLQENWEMDRAVSAPLSGRSPPRLCASWRPLDECAQDPYRTVARVLERASDRKARALPTLHGRCGVRPGTHQADRLGRPHSKCSYTGRVDMQCSEGVVAQFRDSQQPC